MEVLITNRMIELVKSEAAKCRAYSKAQIPFAQDWAEVANALYAAVEAMSDKLEAQNDSRRCS